LRVLIAEEKNLVASRLSRQLEALGHHVLGVVRDGPAAVATAWQSPPDLIFLDQHLPPHDGIEAARMILRKQTIPLVLLIGRPAAGLTQRAQKAGILSCLVWPRDANRLEWTIDVAQIRFWEFRILRECVGIILRVLAVARPYRVLLADDHQIFRQGLRGLLERTGFTVVAEAGDGREAVRLAQEHGPDVAILDIAMPLLDGSGAAQEIARTSTGTRTILLTMHSEEPYVVAALQAGVRGYVLKTQSATELVTAIQEVMRGGIYLSPDVLPVIAHAYQTKNQALADHLTLRERDVLLLVAEGKTTREAAQLLGISAKTVDTHRTRIMTKLGIHDTAGLVRYAIRHGLIRP
jgi:two-component system, NarL family, response regulator NreC